MGKTGKALLRWWLGKMMAYARITFAAAAASSLIACSNVPSLEQTVGDDAPPIYVRDVIKRVKCEIAESFADRLNDSQFLWLDNWTAKVDLTLQVNDQAGLSPTGSYTKFYQNKFNFSAGSTSLTSPTAIQAVQQTLTVAAGLSYNTQAQRAEAITFTVSLREMKAWYQEEKRKAIRRHETLGEPFDFCEPGERALRGYLGLREWINSALYPVHKEDLRAGIHPQPGGNVAKAPTKSGPGLSAFLFLGREEAIKIANAAVKTAEGQNAAVLKAQTDIGNAAAAVKAARETYIDPFFPILTDDLKSRVTSNYRALALIEERIKEDVENAATTLKEAKDLQQSVLGSSSNGFPTLIADAGRITRDAQAFGDYAAYLAAQAAKVQKTLTDFKPNPPIDGLLHSVQFVITYGGNVTPNWSLLMWKGPGISGPTASASAVRTHILNIAFGAPSEQNRLIQNITISNINTHP